MHDPIEIKQAPLVQVMMLALIANTLLCIPLSFLVSPFAEALRSIASLAVVFGFSVAGLIVLRHGLFRRGVVIVAVGLTLGLSVILALEGVRAGSWALSAYILPVTLAGLLTGRRGITVVGCVCVGLVGGLGALQWAGAGWVGAFPRTSDLLPATISTFVSAMVLGMAFFHRFAASLRVALTDTLAREEELKQIRDNLEVLVNERTQSLIDINQRMRKDLTLAHDIQLGLLPKQVPWSQDLAVGCGQSIPATDVGGDFYTFIALDDPQRIAIAVGDISGKGVGAALLMALMVSAVEAEARVCDEPGAVLTALNQHMYARLKANHMNVALAYLVIDLRSRTLHIANAGMVFPIILGSGELRTLEIGGFPIGSLPAISYATSSFPLEDGAIVVLQTDGITEAHDRQRALFGFERMESVLRQLPDPPCAEHVVAGLFGAVASFARDMHQHDDMTVVAVQMGRG
ncbi:MAG TPA: SpoIIE family protein phosphatase [Herpetosiphonaceae bacterium]